MLAGYIAYTMLFALFPFLIFLTALAGLIGQDAAVVGFVELGLDALPAEVRAVLARPIYEVLATPRPGLLTASLVAALWVASSGFEALRAGLNEAYDADQPRALWWRRLESLLLTVLLAAAILGAMVALVVGPLVWSLLQWLAGEVGAPSVWRPLYAAIRYVLAGGVLLAATWALYYLLPETRLRKRDAVPGAGIAVALWAAGAGLFSWYLSNLGKFTVTYGSLGGIVLSLFFFYVTAAIFIFGAEINAAIRRLDRIRRTQAVAAATAAGGDRARRLARSRARG